MTTSEHRPAGGEPDGAAKRTAGRTSDTTVGPGPDNVPVLERPELDPTLTSKLAALAQAGQDEERLRWREAALRAVELLAATGRHFTVEDVRNLGIPEPSHPARWGAVFVTAHREETIRCVGSAPASRRPRHASLNRIWTGVIETGEAA